MMDLKSCKPNWSSERVVNYTKLKSFSTLTFTVHQNHPFVHLFVTVEYFRYENMVHCVERIAGFHMQMEHKHAIFTFLCVSASSCNHSPCALQVLYVTDLKGDQISAFFLHTSKCPTETCHSKILNI